MSRLWTDWLGIWHGASRTLSMLTWLAGWHCGGSLLGKENEEWFSCHLSSLFPSPPCDGHLIPLTLTTIIVQLVPCFQGSKQNKRKHHSFFPSLISLCNDSNWCLSVGDSVCTPWQSSWCTSVTMLFLSAIKSLFWSCSQTLVGGCHRPGFDICMWQEASERTVATFPVSTLFYAFCRCGLLCSHIVSFFGKEIQHYDFRCCVSG